MGRTFSAAYSLLSISLAIGFKVITFYYFTNLSSVFSLFGLSITLSKDFNYTACRCGKYI